MDKSGAYASCAAHLLGRLGITTPSALQTHRGMPVDTERCEVCETSVTQGLWGLVWAGAGYWNGVGGNAFNSPWALHRALRRIAGLDPGSPHQGAGGRLPEALANGTAWGGFVAPFRPSQGSLRFAIWRQVEKTTTQKRAIHHHHV